MVIEVDQNKFFVNKPKDGNPDYFYAPIWMHKFNNQHFYFFIEEHELRQVDSIALENALQNKLSNAFLMRKTNYCFEGENGEKFDLKKALEKCFSEVKNAQKTMKDIQQGFPTSTIHNHHDLFNNGPMLIFVTDENHFYYISNLQEIRHLENEEVRTFFADKLPKKDVKKVEENEPKKRKRNDGEEEEMPTAKRIRIDEEMATNWGIVIGSSNWVKEIEIAEVDTKAHSPRPRWPNAMDIVEVDTKAHSPQSPKSPKANIGISGMEIVEVDTNKSHSQRPRSPNAMEIAESNKAHSPRSPKSPKTNFGILKRKIYMTNVKTEKSIKEGVLIRKMANYNPVIHKFIGPADPNSSD